MVDHDQLARGRREPDRCEHQLDGLREPDSDLYSIGAAIVGRREVCKSKLENSEPMKLKGQSGFTLSELLVAAGLSLAVMASIYGLFRSQTHTIKGQESRMEAHEYAMAILDAMVREIRNTGYFPTGTACGNVANTAGVAAATT